MIYEKLNSINTQSKFQLSVVVEKVTGEITALTRDICMFFTKIRNHHF